MLSVLWCRLLFKVHTLLLCCIELEEISVLRILHIGIRIYFKHGLRKEFFQSRSYSVAIRYPIDDLARAFKNFDKTLFLLRSDGKKFKCFWHKMNSTHWCNHKINKYTSDMRHRTLDDSLIRFGKKTHRHILKDAGNVKVQIVVFKLPYIATDRHFAILSPHTRVNPQDDEWIPHLVRNRKNMSLKINVLVWYVLSCS